MICHPEFLKALPLHRVANSNIFHLNWPTTTGRVNNREANRNGRECEREREKEEQLLKA